MSTVFSLIQITPVFLLLGFAAEHKLAVSEIRLWGVMEIIVAISLFSTTFFVGRHSSATLASLLFLCFGLFHLFNLNEQEYSCGCFGGGVYSPFFMAAGCILFALSQLIFVWDVKVAKRLSRMVLFFALVASGGVFFYFGKVSSIGDRKVIFDFCEFTGSSVPFSDWDEIDRSLGGVNRFIVLSRNCKKCEEFLPEVLVDVDSYLGFRYLVVIYFGDEEKPAICGLRTPQHLYLDVPKVIEVSGGLLSKCSPIEFIEER